MFQVLSYKFQEMSDERQRGANSGREAFLGQRSRTARFGGAQGRESVGISNHNPDEISGRRKPKVSLAMHISQGLGGPKLMQLKVVFSDGQTVNIPSPRRFLKE